MKKYLKPKFLPYVTLIACVLGFLLRLWTLGGGPGKGGLYEPQPVAWVLLWVLTAGLAAAILYLTRRLNVPGKYADNFPPSLAGAAGGFLGAVGVMMSALKILTTQTIILDIVAGILGIVSAFAILLTALNRRIGKKSGFLFHTLPCLFFALRIFTTCREWSTEPQLSKFLCPFLASIAIMLAVYQLAAFDVNLGKRQHSLFWSLMASYLCCLSLPLCDEVVFYAAMAGWLMTNLCSLRPMKKKAAPAPEEATAAEPAPTAEAAEEVMDNTPAQSDELE